MPRRRPGARGVPRTDRPVHEAREVLLDDAGHTVSSAYARKLKETLRRAVRDGYDGVDIVHDRVEVLFGGPRTSVWRAEKWRDEPSTTPDGSYRRYDFRYYDREALLCLLGDGGRPEDDEADP